MTTNRLRLHPSFRFLSVGRSCDVCGNPMLASMTGGGYCLVCGIPSDEIPLVPVIAAPTAFHRIVSAWERRFEPLGVRAAIMKDWTVAFGAAWLIKGETFLKDRAI